MGDSAGGHIAQMLLLSSPESLPGDPTLAEVTYRMVAGVSWYGPCDFEKTDLFNHDDRPDFRDRFGPRILGSDSGPQDKLTRYREMSPINYLTPTSPPLLMIQGDKDTTIPVKHAYYMQERAKAVQAPVEILIVKNSGHNWRSVGRRHRAFPRGNRRANGAVFCGPSMTDKLGCGPEDNGQTSISRTTDDIRRSRHNASVRR